MNLHDVTDQCLMLANSVESAFPGKLWCCTTCKDDKGAMKGYTLNARFINKTKFHFWKSTCKLFLSDLLPSSKKNWGKNQDYQRAGYEEFVYGRPVELRAERQKKCAAPVNR